MPMLVIRFAFSLTVIVSGAVVFALAGMPSRRARDPALRLLRIPLVPELLFAAIEAAFLAFSLARLSPPGVLAPLSECLQFSFGPAYILFMYRSWSVNGLSVSRYLPFKWFVGAILVNYFVFAAQYPFPALVPAIRIVNKSITGALLLYAGACAVIARGKKEDFYPSTKGGFWMAFFSLAYAPFVGLADMYSLSVPTLDAERSVALQLFPARELIVLLIYIVHLEPLNSRLWKAKDVPLETLSAREGEVAALMRRGKTNDEIARRLNVSPATVKTHVRSVLRKSAVRSRAELIEADANGRTGL